MQGTLFCQTPLTHCVTYLHIWGVEGVAPTCNKTVVNCAQVTLEFLSARHCTIPGHPHPRPCEWSPSELCDSSLGQGSGSEDLGTGLVSLGTRLGESAPKGS